MGDVLAFVEQREGTARGVSLEVMSAAAALAAELGGKAHAVILGGPGAAGAAAALGAHGAEVIHAGEHPDLEAYSAEGYAPALEALVGGKDFAAVLFAATSLGRDLAPHVAARLGVPLASDVTELSAAGGSITLRRPVYSGKAFARLSTDATPVIATLRPNIFAATQRPAAGQVESFTPDVDASSFRVRTVGFEAAGGDLDVAEAAIVVSGGRGMKEPENWSVLEGLRDALGTGQAALGASRAVVDSGWRPHAEQVGQTGTKVAPELYLAFGISGATQHIAGCKSAKTLIAVNTDAQAPIMTHADYAVVDNLHTLLPALIEKARAAKGA